MFVIDYKNFKILEVVRYEKEDISYHGSCEYQYVSECTSGEVHSSPVKPFESREEAINRLKVHINAELSKAEISMLQAKDKISHLENIKRGLDV